MLTKYQNVLIFNATLLLLLPLVHCTMDFPKENHNAKELDDDKVLPLSNDEISYALSELSVDDLNALSQLMDVLNEYDDHDSENDIKGQYSSDELARFKRENSDTPTEEDQDNSMPNVDEEYIKQLDDSFPNVEQSNQDDKEKEHVRVKRQ